MSSSQAETFRNLATKFRKLADQVSDEATAVHLRKLAAEYEEHSDRPIGAATGPIPTT